MAAPIRFLSGRQQQQKIGIEGNTDNEKVLEVVGRVGIGTTIFEPDSELEVRGDVKVSGIITANNISVSSGNVNIDQLNVTGVSTFASAADFNGDVDIDGHTELDDVNASGISSATAFANFDYLQAPFGSTVTFTVTVASKDSSHRYQGQGSGNGYLINGVQAPFLTLTPGRTYRFTNDNTGSHPLKFYLEADKTTEYTSGVSFQNTYTEITVSDQTPVVLHYQCTAHAYMGNAIQTNSNVVNTNYAATLRDSLTVSGDINANGNIVGDNSTNITGMSGVTASTLTGTLQTAAQPNITSLGTLSSLTVSGAIDANADVDIDGHLEVDNVNISGIATVGGLLDINAGAQANTLKVEDLTDNRVVIAGTGGELEDDANLTFNGTQLAVGVNLDVDGHTELDDVNISGVLTATTLNVTGGGGSGSQANLTNLSVSGVSTFTGAIDANGSLDVDGQTELDDLNVSGVSTFNDQLKMADNTKIMLGDSNDMQIVHIPGTGNSIQGTQPIYLQTTSEIVLREYGGSEIFGKFIKNGAVELYHDNSKKFETTASGIDVTGHSELDDVNVSGVSTFTGAIDANGSLDVDGHTELDDVNVSGASTFAGAIDANGGLDVSGGSGLVASSAKISDLTDNRIVIAGASGELEDTSKVTFDGTTLNIVGNATFTGNVSVAGTLTSEDKTNIDSIGIVTARTGVRVNSGGLVVSSGVATFTDAIDANGGANISGGSGLVASTAKVSDLTSGRVVFAGTAGELQDSGNFTFNGTTLAAPQFSGDGTNITGLNASQVAGAIEGITVREEGSIVGSANSVGSLNFVGSNILASASGVGATITLTNNPTFTNVSATNVSASSSITAATFYGDGSNLDNISVDNVIGAVSGVTIKDEGIVVGLANSIGSLNFVGPGVTATASGAGSTITVAGFVQDADGNLFAGNNAGGSYDPVTGTSEYNVFLGQNSGTCIANGDGNIAIGRAAGCRVSTGSCNIFLGFYSAGGFGNKTGDHNIVMGRNAAFDLNSGGCNVILGEMAGKQVSGGSQNIFIGKYSGCGGSNKSGLDNISLGTKSGVTLSTGNANVSIGKCSGGVTTGSHNNMIGCGAGQCAAVTGCHNTFIGSLAGKCATGSGGYNNFIGANAGFNNTTGGCNVFLGNKAGCSNTTGNNNAFLGSNVGIANTSGVRNVFIGNNAGVANTTGGYNNMIGNAAGQCATVTGQNNTFLGSYAGKCASGASNCNNIIGFCAGRDNQGSINNFMGRCAGLCNTSGTYNNFIGERAGTGWNGAQTGFHNNFIGSCAGCDNQSGGCNNFIGRGAGKSNLTGEQNVYIGDQVGGASTTGSGNVMIGKCTGASAVVTGSDNIFLGTDAGKSASGSGTCNTFIGYNAGKVNSSGFLNNFIGREAGCENTTGAANVFLGHRAGNCNTEGSLNTFVGSYAGRKNTTGGCNVFLGNNVGVANTTGTKNIYIGSSIADNAVSSCANANIVIGQSSAKCISGNCNIILGCCTGGQAANLTGDHNFIAGYCAGKCQTTGNNNLIIGQNAGQSNTGSSNVMFGTSAGASNTGSNNFFVGTSAGASNTGSNNVAFGVNAGCSLTDGIHNILIGACAGKGNAGADDNIFMGRSAAACATITGNCNIAIGPFAMRNLSSGFWNVAIGRYAGSDTNTGQYNVFLGACAGNTNSSGSGNVAIGFNVELPSGSGGNQLAIGYQGNRWIAGDSGFNISVNGVTATGVVTATDFNSTSDAKLKTNVQVISDPLDKIVRIDGVSFNWIENNKPSMGVIADNIEEVLPELVSDTDPKTVNYNGLIGLLIEVVKDQQTQINSLNERLSQLE